MTDTRKFPTHDRETLINAMILVNRELENMTEKTPQTLAYRIMFDDLSNCRRTLAYLHEYLSQRNSA